MTLTLDQVQKFAGGGGKVVGPDGAKIGSIGQIYLDNDSGSPEWVTVSTGLFGSSESFVPLQGAQARGDDIAVDFDKDTVKDAPRIDADGSLTPQDEERLYAHYGLNDTYAGRGTVTGDVADGRADDVVTTGHDTSGPTTDDAMTRSEEQLRIGTQTREAGRARLRKYVVTENVSQTVPLRHEEVRVTREPITDANRDKALDGPEITEAVHEVTLHAEVPVVQKETVAMERVKLGTETVVEQATVNETVRKEQIEVDGDVQPDSR